MSANFMPDYMVCHAVLDVPKTPIPSTTEICCGCGGEVWVSKASALLIKQKNLSPICVSCANNKAADGELDLSPDMAEIDEIQIKEIRDSMNNPET